MAFQKAHRAAVKLKLAFTGPSGSGKTWGALAVASGLVEPGQRVALIDTENRSASLFADAFDFDAQDLQPPYTVEKYLKALQEAVAAGYGAVVIDSLSHAWAGEGGLLERKRHLDFTSRSGNGFTNWGAISEEHERFKSALLKAPIHVLATIRAKTEYVVEEDERGKKVPRKVGLGLIQRDGLEYEFSSVFELDQAHVCTTSKDRTSLFDGRTFQLTPEVGQRLRTWLQTAPAQDSKAFVDAPVPHADTRGFGAMAREIQAEKAAAAEDRVFRPEVEDFVDGVAAGPAALPPGDDAWTQATEDEESREALTKPQYEQLNAALGLWPELAGLRDNLRAYCHRRGYLLPAREGRASLARLRQDKFSTLMGLLGDDARRPELIRVLSSEPATPQDAA